MGWTSTAEDIRQRQVEAADGREFGPIPAENESRTPGGFRRVGPKPDSSGAIELRRARDRAFGDALQHFLKRQSGD